MPRKQQPIPILRIESLSTGRVYQANAGVDDFTGQPIVPVDDTPINPIADPDIARDQAKRERRAEQRVMLEKLGIIEQTVVVAPEPMAQHIPGKRAIVVSSGLSMHLPLPPWRRG